MWTYRAYCLEVIDADTLEFRVDLGFDTHGIVRVRLKGVNCAEKSTPEGKRALGYVRDMVYAAQLSHDWPFEITTQRLRDDSRERMTFTRYVADVTFRSSGLSLAQCILDNGYGSWDGKGHEGG